ncbi:probable WRKY transcription factor 46 [Diospyros lotus]|uniref:probable WRKY transcription factor 46 n=1 Tax=Diospyros lotus TaxID=55363 RepID=UPI00224E151C|nr:probable WRKY transcription factor 46 [Diospyros lotus]
MQTISRMLEEQSAANEVSQIPANYSLGSSPWWDGWNSEGSSEKCLSSAVGNRTGCHKRRRTGEAWTKLTRNSVADGYTWRKYGQKVILNTKHPRNYYRCTHKFEKGCEARKQVQQTKDNPPMFITTYHGRHTCRNNPIHNSPHVIIDSAHLEPNTSVLISFRSTTSPNTAPPEPFFPATSFINQQESKEKKSSWIELPNQASPSSDNTLLPSQLDSGGGNGNFTAALEPFGASSALSSEEYEGMDMDIAVEDIEFDNLFGLI